MRIPDPKANTTTEAYLAYKAGYLEESELKPSLYEPYLHFDAWLAYWAGLANDFPAATISQKNLFNVNGKSAVYRVTKSVRGQSLTVVALVDGVGYASVVIPNSEKLLGKSCTISYNASASAGEARLRIAPCSTSSPDVVGSIIASQNGNGSQSLSFTFPNSFEAGKNAFAVLFYVKNGSDIVVGDSASYSNIQIELGGTPSEYEPYATPEMLCDEEALVAYLSGVTDTYPEEIKDPYDVRIVGYLKHIAANRWPEPDYPVNNEEFYLSTMEPTHTSNPEPSSDIELDTSEGKILDVEAYGDTSQIAYTGKNLYNATKAETETHGITWSADNGQLYIDGQRDLSTGATYAFGDTTLPAGTYTLTLELVSGSLASESTGGLFYFSGSGISTSPAQVYIKDSSKKASMVVTVPENADCHIYVYARVSESFNNAVIKYQLVEGSTADYDFEPYVGGIASPNPDYPQDVNVVTGEQSVGISGKNMFDAFIATKPSWQSGNLVLDEDGGIIISGNTSANGYFALGETLGVLCPDLKVGDEVYLYMDTTGREIIYPGVIWNNGQKKTITQDMLSNIVAIYGGHEGKTDTIKIMITKEQDTNYQPYQEPQTYKINLGKNLLQIIGTTSNGLTSSNQNGILKISGEATDNWAFVVPETSSSLSAGEYTLSINNSLSHSVDVRFYFNDGTNQTYAIGAGNTTTTFTTTKSANKYAVLFGGITNGQEYDETIELQLELGSTATEFAPYFEPIELCKIGDHQDYIYKSGDDWYVHKDCGKIAPDGSVGNWYQGGDLGDNSYYYTQYYDDVILGTSGVVDGFSDKFRVVPRAQADYGKNIIYLTSEWAKLRFYIDKTIVSGSAVNFKAWLSQNTPVIYHILVTPTDTKITDATLISQLEAILNADTYDGKTFIKVTTNDPNLPALLKVEAYSY